MHKNKKLYEKIILKFLLLVYCQIFLNGGNFRFSNTKLIAAEKRINKNGIQQQINVKRNQKNSILQSGFGIATKILIANNIGVINKTTLPNKIPIFFNRSLSNLYNML